MFLNADGYYLKYGKCCMSKSNVAIVYYFILLYQIPVPVLKCSTVR